MVWNSRAIESTPPLTPQVWEFAASVLREVVEQACIWPIAHADMGCDAGTRVKEGWAGATEMRYVVEDMTGLSQASGPNIVFPWQLWLSNTLNSESIGEL
jgi:hypothetical protein